MHKRLEDRIQLLESYRPGLDAACVQRRIDQIFAKMGTSHAEQLALHGGPEGLIAAVRGTVKEGYAKY